ncbi:glycoside hydrolase family 32 protein [Pseudobutyrivibrio sp. MD2005]|uniref:glycoside hydrolase family 32 protein n=1 Tax=Pseudobutyrivibrio sp. MD2005 TaxID=1410616 RepID=UPI000489CE29|nr:glycoside hydrolase family 32 protein [Pseudobutyrivibrio sp. MD2005]
MKKGLLLLLVGAVGLNAIGCGSSAVVEEQSNEKYIGEDMTNYSLYPASIEGFVGDTMPYFEDGTMNVFYLADQRNGKQGYHPWGLIQTKDFVNYDDSGVVINYGETVESQDIALGTGSVIKDKDGVYHAFYTGHNDTFSPKEAVMHATSNDMKSWTKIPEDTFTSTGNYSTNDFRDPYVYYSDEDKCYEMLVTTRHENMGVIVRYSSKDLSKWNDEGVFFENDMGSDSNMECPSLLQYKGKYYLAFSDQWPYREVHYRIADSINGPFEKTDVDIFDGNGFYAGRLETDGDNLYVVGWNGTKKNHMDTDEYDWGGNMVIHQLAQKKDGTLVPIVNTNIENTLNNEIKISPVKLTESAKADENKVEFSGNQYEMAGYNNIMGSYLLKTTVKNFDENSMFGFCFNTNVDSVGNLNIVFNGPNKRIEFYNCSNIMEATAQSYIDFDLKDEDELNISIVISDGVVVMYVNDEMAFTTRMYLSQGMDFGVFSINSDVVFDDIKLYK